MTNKLSEKDKKDWHKFVNSEEKLEIKDNEFLKQDSVNEKFIDLHGFTLDEANDKIFKFISYCYQNKVKKINVITGKGMRSKNLNDPYKSSNLGILKHWKHATQKNARFVKNGNRKLIHGKYFNSSHYIVIIVNLLVYRMILKLYIERMEL